jgi:hypothetical protein
MRNLWPSIHYQGDGRLFVLLGVNTLQDITHNYNCSGDIFADEMCGEFRALQCVSQTLGELSVVLRFDGLLELLEELPGDQAHVALEKSSLACTCSCRSSDINEIKCSKQAWSTPWYLIMATSAPT